MRLFLVLGAILAVVCVLPVTSLEWVAPCAVRAFIGIDCPGCGLLHSWSALVHGDFTGALQYYPMGPFLFVGLVLFFLESFWFLFRQDRCNKTFFQSLLAGWGVWGLVLIFIQWATKLSGII